MVKDDDAYNSIFSAARWEPLSIDDIIGRTGLPREQVFRIVNTYPEFHDTGGHYLAYKKPEYIRKSELRKKGPPPPRMPYGPRTPKITPKPTLIDEMRAIHREAHREANYALNNAYVVRRLIERNKMLFEKRFAKLVRVFHTTLDMFKEETPGFYRMKR